MAGGHISAAFVERSVSRLTYPEECCTEWFANVPQFVTRFGVRC